MDDLIYCSSQDCPYKTTCARANLPKVRDRNGIILYNYQYECTLSDGFQYYIKTIK